MPKVPRSAYASACALKKDASSSRVGSRLRLETAGALFAALVGVGVGLIEIGGVGFAVVVFLGVVVGLNEDASIVVLVGDGEPVGDAEVGSMQSPSSDFAWCSQYR